MVEERLAVLQSSIGRSRRDTAWTDGLRVDDDRVGPACGWRTLEWRTGHRYHLGTKKEVFEAKTLAEL